MSQNLSALTQIQAAALLSVAPRTLRDWHDAPRNKDATYPGPALVAYYVEKITGSGEFDDQRQRLAAAQAEKVERENSVRRGELAQRRDVERFLTDCFANARAKVLAIDSKLSPRLVNIADPRIIAAAIRAEAYAVLSELVEYEPGGRGGVDPAGEQDLGAASGPDGEPVVRPRKATQQRKQRRAGAVAD